MLGAALRYNLCRQLQLRTWPIANPYWLAGLKAEYTVKYYTRKSLYN